MRIPWPVPVMQAPIGPAATTELVGAVSATGALGTLAASWTDPARLREQLQRLRSQVAGHCCVNLVLAFDQRERLEVAIEEGAPMVSFSWGIDATLIARAHEAGLTVLVQVGSADDGRRAAEAGADLLIAQGCEAGGHVQGTTPLAELVAGVKEAGLPVVAAGGIGDAEAVRRALDGGAHAVACGTAYLVAHEANVHPHYRERLLAAAAADTVLTNVFDVGWRDAPHRVLRNATLTEGEVGNRPGAGEVVAMRGGHDIVRYADAQPTASTEGDIEAMAMYAGTSVDGVKEEAGAAEITRRLASLID